MKLEQVRPVAVPGPRGVPRLRVEPLWRRGAILLVLLSGPAFLAMVFTVIPPALPGIAAHFGGGAAGQLVAQLVMTLPSIGMMAGGPLSGWLIDRYRARRLLLAALASYGLLGLAGTLLDGQWSLLAARLLQGFAACAMVTATNTLIGERYDAATRARLLGYGTFCGAGAGLASILLSGVIAEAGSWHAPFALYGLALGMLPLAAIVLPAGGGGTSRTEARQGGAASALLGLAPLYAVIALVFVAVFMTNAQVSFLLLADGVSGPAAQSRIIGWSSLTNGLGGASYGWLRARLGLRWSFVAMLGLLAAGITTLGLSHDPLMATLGCALTGFGGGLAVPHFLNMVLDRAEPAVRSRALGLAYSALFLGDFMNPFLMAPLTAVTGIHGAFLTVGACLAAAAVYQALRRGAHGGGQ
ncbi:MFS transporter [Pseudoduganella namucuonensis]|uniref:Predicted arabinose efflux permease, MFS family n=1 Tax=Pseudoduganella namucuonensis TaxID=1035707 RepID=A0A1I7LSE4_9BURK|nr:MFS transporter [Pseudoduganella namucuonensis]SFV12490.1 Predicted arabinose efflux permease, MFS family [Pseudoduganella namucuonensis]